jgi:nucleoside-diphosphate-sugar epimerase
MQTKPKILITGASGFLGYHLVQSALEMGLDVSAGIRNNSNTKHLQAFPVKYVYPDFDNIKSLENEFDKQQYDYIIHAAGITKAKKEEDFNNVNARYTYNIATAAAKMSSLKKIVFISSLAAVGPLENMDGVITEHTTPQPVTGYGKSKLLAEQQLTAIDIPWLILRPTAIYGPREKDIFILLRMIRNGIEPYIGNMPQQLSFIHVGDVADAAVNALFSRQQKKIYNLADGNSYNRYELAGITKSVLKKRTIRFHLPIGFVRSLAGALETTYDVFNKVPALNKDKIQELTASNWNCSITKAAHELGFNPSYTLKEGLTQTLQWYKRHKWL